MSTSQHTSQPLQIGKLRTRFVGSSELDDVQVRQWHEAFAEQDPADLVGHLVSDEEWLLIRHLPLQLRWRPDSAATDVGRAWLQALQVGVEQAASGHDAGNVLRYRVKRHGLADLLYRSALGEVDRQWAWRRMGLIDREGLAAADALQQGAQALLGEPDWIWPVLHHCLQADSDTGAFTALVRRLPASTWAQWLQAAPQSRAWVGVWQATAQTKASAHDQAAPRIFEHAQAAHADALVQPSNEPGNAPGIQAQSLLQWARRHPQLASKLGDVLSVWLAAMSGAEPGAVDAANQRVHMARQGWQQAVQSEAASTTRHSSRLPQRQPDSASQPHTAQADARRANTPQAPAHANTHSAAAPQASVANTDAGFDHGLPEAPALPEPDHSVRTAWAGALFFLRLLCQPDVMRTLQAQAGFDPDETAATAVLMQAVAMALHVPADDPVMRVLTAGQFAPDISPSIQAAANRLVAQWAKWLDEALPDAPEPRLTWVCQRPGRLQIEPGWIELHLDMEQIDTRLRRVGLDLDPGWVPLIGAVVRICYD